ncbi:MAG: hypothetical protein SP1CHLAM42_09320 [Chlamydiales bacterium]|nr:hypothetical protein [Chlamydiales bacterium]
MRRTWLLLILGLFTSLYAEDLSVHTFPKSGTHFLSALFTELQLHLIGGHAEEVLKLSDTEKYCVTIRDFRDFWISLRDFMDKVALRCIATHKRWPGIATDRKTYVEYLRLSREERLLCLMQIGSQTPFPQSNLMQNLRGVEKAFANPNALILRFEDYIGSAGGESNKRQEEVLEKLFMHFGIVMERSNIRKAADKVWGTKTTTMNKGTTGRWKEEFNPKVTKIFKEHWNQVLLDWGYETEWDWDKNYELPL